MQLANKVAVLTGAASGIGEAIALASAYITGSTFIIDGGMIRQAGSL
jgi:NADP-dependent 3-hydroxy acid dehydrogenase YdfG